MRKIISILLTALMLFQAITPALASKTNTACQTVPAQNIIPTKLDESSREQQIPKDVLNALNDLMRKDGSQGAEQMVQVDGALNYGEEKNLPDPSFTNTILPAAAAVSSPPISTVSLDSADQENKASESAPAPSTVQFENASYYAVRSDDYIYIPVVVTGNPSTPSVTADYTITGAGTAVPGIDYEAVSGKLSISKTDRNRQYSFIKIKLINNKAATGDKTLQLSLGNPNGVSLGNPAQTVITIRPSYDYVVPDRWETLYDGYNYGNTGIGNWDGVKVGSGFGAEETPYGKTFKTLSVSGWRSVGTQGFQAKKTYRMSQLSFKWRTSDSNNIYAVVSTQSGNVSGNRDSLPNAASIIGRVNTRADYFTQFTIPSENIRAPLYVGFYADYTSPLPVLELLNVSILKKKFDFNISIPEGSALEVAGKQYGGSFAGKFFYDGGEKVKAIPPVGHSFAGWDVYLPNGQTKSLTDAHTSLAQISSNDLIQRIGEANFILYESKKQAIQLRPVFEKSKYTITANSEPGAGGTVAGSGTYLYGDQVALTATPNAGYVFSHWSSTGPQKESKDNPWIFTANSTLTATAYFKRLVSIDITSSSPEGGTAVIVGTAMENAPVMARAAANPGYRFVKWTNASGEELSTDADYVFTGADNLHLVAVFESIASHITVKAFPPSAGKTTVSGDGTIKHGETVTLTAEPNSEYMFINWTEDGKEVSSEAVWRSTIGSGAAEISDGDHLFTANFRLKPGSFSMAPNRQFTGVPVFFDASRVFQDRDGISFSWQFGDGATAAGENVSHAFTAAGTYEVTLTAIMGTKELTRKVRTITIVDPLPTDQSDFTVNPEGVSLVAPGGKASWTAVFTNNGVPMASQVIHVNNELLGESTDIITNEVGEARYETTVPAAMAQYDLYRITFSHDAISVSRALQVFSSNITLTGQVFNSFSGRRLPGVRVLAGGSQALTDNEGRYTITGLSSSDYTVTAVLDGYQAASYKARLNSSQAVMNIPLVRSDPGTVPTIGWIHSERSDSAGLVYKYFPYQESMPLTFTVDIDWRGHEPGVVNFILPDKTVTGTLAGEEGYTAARTIDVGSEIAPTGHLFVQLVTQNGAVKSLPVDAMIEVTPPAPFDTSTRSTELPKVPPMTLAQDMDFVGGHLISLDLGKVKTEVEIDVNGVASMYLGVVCAKKDATPADLTDKNQYEKLKKAYGDLKSASKVKDSSFGYEVIVGGKLVYVYDQVNKRWQFEEGWMVINGSGEYTYTCSYMTPVLIPVYIKVGAGGSLTVHLGLTPFEEQKWNGSLTPEMWVRVAAGVGIADLLAVGIYGELRGKITFIINPARVDNWAFGLTCGVEVVAFIFSYEKSYTKTWFFPSAASESMTMPVPDTRELTKSFAMPAADSVELKPLARDYLQRPTVWMPQPEAPNRVRLMAADSADTVPGSSNCAETVIQQNIFPFSEPSLIQTEDGPMMAWVADNPRRSDNNRTEVQYSTGNDGVWSEPKAVDDDGTADFYPEITPLIGGAGGNTAAAAWINVASELNDSAGLGELLSQSRVAVSLYDKSAGTWEHKRVFAAEGFQDTSPKVADLNGSALVVWNRSSISGAQPASNDVSGEVDADAIKRIYPQQTDLMFSSWNGMTWSEPQAAVKGVGSVIKSSLAGSGGNALFAYTVDLDGNLGTAEDQELYYITFDGSWSTPVRVTDNQIKDTNPRAVYLNGEPMLFWYQEGNVLCMKGLASAPMSVVAGSGEGLAGFTLAAGGAGTLTLVWGEASGTGQELYAAVYDPKHSSWSKPIQITHTGTVNRSVDAMLDEEGNILAVYNRTAMEPGGEKSSSGQTDLVFTKVILGHDAAAEELALEQENPAPGSKVNVRAVVANRGELAEKDLQVAFYAGDPSQGGVQIGEIVVLDGLLAASEKREVTIQWTVPKKLGACDLYVVVDPEKTVPDRNRENNTASAAVMKTNLQILDVKNQPVGYDQYLISATVTNRGLVTANDTRISLYKTQPGEYGPEKGELIETRDLGELQPGQQKEDNFTWFCKDDDFKDGYTFLVLAAVSAQDNVLTGDNSASVMVRQPVRKGGSVTGFVLSKNAIALLTGEQQQLRGIFEPSDAANQSIAWRSDNETIARVDAAGKVRALAVGKAVITATTVDGGITDSCTVTVTDPIPPAVHVTGVSLNRYTLSIAKGGSESLLAAVLPADATDQRVTWSSDQTAIATVDSGGIVTGIGAGQAAITVTTIDGSKSAACQVTVTAPGVSYNPVPSAEVVTCTSGFAYVTPSMGGSVGLGNDAAVRIPAGALAGGDNVKVTVARVKPSGAIPAGFIILGNTFEFKIADAASCRFNKPVTLVFSFDPALVPAGVVPAVNYYDEKAQAWIDLGGTVSGNTITVTVDHFTQFAILIKEKEKTDQQIPAQPAAAVQTGFRDINKHWASESIKAMAAGGIISGYDDGTFKPERAMSKAEFLVVAARAFNLAPDNSYVVHFTDKNKIQSWAYGYIAASAKAGLIPPTWGSVLNSTTPITRAEIAYIVSKSTGESALRKTGFKDPIQGWAVKAIMNVTALKIMNGYPDRTFRPGKAVTRGEVCTILVNMRKVSMPAN